KADIAPHRKMSAYDPKRTLAVQIVSFADLLLRFHVPAIERQQPSTPDCERCRGQRRDAKAQPGRSYFRASSR
ncbi:MAG: hypothetical protein WBW27_07830, partial [Pseudolabrys sp.]